MTRSARALALAALWLSVAQPARAQFSPGPLHRGHASLEGTRQCQACHDPREGVAPRKCLACHAALAERIDARQGLHARPGYGDCRLCHVEHQGADVALVHWGEGGRAGFVHAEAGWVLEGAHLKVACESCHQASRVRASERLQRGGANPQHTFLGLARECRACHADAHRGQFGERACRECHDLSGWRPAPGFDHARARFALTGLHARVACERCHATARGGTSRSFRGVAFAECSSCHRDPHAARLGASCSRCHTTAGWQQASLQASKGFDHSRTGYPLAGRHAAVACDGCHAAGAPLRPKHDRCTDCHDDTHRGQLKDRTDGGRCDACHSVAGFLPARYGLTEHGTTRYPLEGAHRAVACDACHRGAPAAAVKPAAAGRRTGVVPAAAVRPPTRPVASAALQLRPAGRRCGDCHGDPHRGELAARVAAGGCESCHAVESWRRASFDHATTRFPLGGPHARAACGACHPPVAASGKATAARWAGRPVTCDGCHADAHAGQFAARGAGAGCERCHDPLGAAATRFDHGRDAAWALDGAHRRLACAACHPREPRGERTFVRYKPRPTTCRGCHAAAEPAVSKGAP